MIEADGRRIGPGEPCFVIAEAGSNHGGDLGQALALVDVAAEAGADAVKFQVFRAARLYARGAGRSDYLGLEQSIHDVIAELELPPEWLPELAGRCGERRLTFMASAFDEESVALVDPHVALHKVASYELTHAPLLERVAATGKPLVLSTGTADLDEVRAAVEGYRASGGGPLALLQCTAAYPAPLESLNVRAMDALREAFDVPVGLSDHSRDPVVGPIAAVAAGANLLEKHFTLSNDLPGPDHRFAVEPHELRDLVARVRQTEAALGSGDKRVDPVEAELRAFARRSVFATAPIAAGEPFTEANVAVLRNGKLDPGLPPGELTAVLRGRAARAIAPDEPIRAGDLA